MEDQLRNLQRDLSRKIAKAKPVVDKVAKGELLNLSEEEQRLVSNYPRWVEDLDCVKKGEMPTAKPAAAVPSSSTQQQQEETIINNDNDDDQQEQEEVAAEDDQQEEEEADDGAAVEEEQSAAEANNNDDDNEVEDESSLTWADLNNRQLIRRLHKSTKTVRRAQIEAFVTRNVDSSAVLKLTKKYEAARNSNNNEAEISSVKKELQQEQNKVRIESDKIRNAMLNEVAKLEKEIADAAEAVAAEQRRNQQAASAAKKEEKKKAAAERRKKEEEEKAKEARRLLEEAEKKQREENAFSAQQQEGDSKVEEEVNPFDADQQQNDSSSAQKEKKEEKPEEKKQKEQEPVPATAATATSSSSPESEREEKARKRREAIEKKRREDEEAEKKKQEQQKDEDEEKQTKKKQQEEEEAAAAAAAAAKKKKADEEAAAAAAKKKKADEEAAAAAAKKKEEQEQKEKEAAAAAAAAADAEKEKEKTKKSILDSSSDEISSDSDEEEAAPPAPAEEEDDDDGFFGGGGDMFDLDNVEKQEKKAKKAKLREEKAARKAKRAELRAAIARGEAPFAEGGNNDNNTDEQQEDGDDNNNQETAAVKGPPKEIDWSVIAIEKNHRRFNRASSASRKQDESNNNNNTDSSSNPASPLSPASPPNSPVVIAKPRHWVLSAETMSRASRASPHFKNNNTSNDNKLAKRIKSELEACLEILPENVTVFEAPSPNTNNNNTFWRINVTPHDGALAGHVIPLSLTFTPYFPFEAPILQTLVDMPLHPLVAAASITQAEFKNCVEYDRQTDGSSSVRPRSASRAAAAARRGGGDASSSSKAKTTRGGSASGGKKRSTSSSDKKKDDDNKKKESSSSTATTTSTRGGAASRVGAAGRNTSPSLTSMLKIDDMTLRSVLTPRWSPLSSVNSIILCVSKLFDAKFLPATLKKNSPTRLALLCDALRNFFTMSNENMATVGVPHVYNGPWKVAAAANNNKDDKENNNDSNNTLSVWDHRYGTGKHTVAFDWRDPTATPNLAVGVQILGGKHFETVIDKCYVNVMNGEQKDFGENNNDTTKTNKNAVNVNGPVLMSVHVDDESRNVTVSFSSPGSPSFKVSSKYESKEVGTTITVAPIMMNLEPTDSENHVIQVAFGIPHNANQNAASSSSVDSGAAVLGNKSTNKKAFFREQTTSIVSAPSFCVVTGASPSTDSSSSSSSTTTPIVLGVGLELTRNSSTGLLTSTRSSCQTISNTIFSRLVGLRDANGLRMDAFMPLLFFDVGANNKSSNNKELKQNTISALKTSIMNIARKPSATTATTIQSGTVALYTPPFVPSTATKTCAMLLDGCVTDLMMILASMPSASSSAVSFLQSSSISSTSSSTKSRSSNLFLAESVVTRYIALVHNFAVLANGSPEMQEYATKAVNEWDANKKVSSSSNTKSSSSSSSASASTCGHPFAFTTVTSNVTWQSATRKALETVLAMGIAKQKNSSSPSSASSVASLTSTSGESEVFTFASSVSPVVFKHILLAASLAAPFSKVPLASLLPLFSDAKEVAKFRTQMMTGIQNVQNGNVTSWSAMDEHFGVLLRVGEIISSVVSGDDNNNNNNDEEEY